MFYCNSCKNKNRWYSSWSKSKGNCEICGNYAICNDVPSSELTERLPEGSILDSYYGTISSKNTDSDK